MSRVESLLRTSAKSTDTAPEVAIITSADIGCCPYIDTYLTNGLNCDVISWNRNGLGGTCPKAANTISFDFRLSDNPSLIETLSGYIRYARFLKRFLKTRNYKKIIVLQVQTGFLIKDYLLKSNIDYILDIRDYSHEYIQYYYNIEASLIQKSKFTVISSSFFQNFLPEHEYLLAHNVPAPLPSMNPYQKDKDRFVISYIGMIGYREETLQFIDALGNDQRFLVRLIGQGSESFEKEISDREYNNIELHGSFTHSEIDGFYTSSDAIMNLYGSGTPLLDCALSNKLYQCAARVMPLLVCPNTAMSSISHDLGIGFDVVYTSQLNDRLYVFLHNYDQTSAEDRCHKFMLKVKKDSNELKTALVHFYGL